MIGAQRRRLPALAMAVGILGLICIALLVMVRPAVLDGSGADPKDAGPCAISTVEAASGTPEYLLASVLDVPEALAAGPGPVGASSVRDVPAAMSPAGSGIIRGKRVPPVGDRQPAFGVVTEGGFGYPEQWDEVSRVAGESPTLLMAYANFTDPLPFAGLEVVAARGATPVLTWEPWNPADGVDQSRFGLSTIVAGHHDAYLREWAGGLKAFGKPVILRFAHEMNYPWYPWGAGVNGNTPEQYVEAWRYVHALFEAEGVGNVSWTWNPQAPECGSSLQPFWPGSDVVDLVALDAYNWGTVRSGERWRSPEELFGEGFRQLRELAPGTPIIIGETASSEAGGSKAVWIADLVRYLGEQPDVQAFIWFDLRKEEDWRIISSESSHAALGEALRERR